MRGFQLEGHPTMARLIGMRDGRVLVAVAGRDGSLAPLQVYDERGRLERSFGPPHFRANWGPRDAIWAGDGSIWLPGPGYRIERCDLDGRVDRIIGVTGPEKWYTDWFPSLFMNEEEFLANERERPVKKWLRPTEPFVVEPKPIPLEVLGLKQIDDSFLLVAAHVFNPGTDADPLPRIVCDPTTGCVQRATPPIELDFQFRLRNTILDLIEICTGNVLAHAEMPSSCYLMSDGTLWRPLVRQETVHVETYEVAVAGSRA
jgi:hypothetical protein